MKHMVILAVFVAAMLAGCSKSPVSVPLGQRTHLAYGNNPHVELVVETEMKPTGLQVTFENVGEEKWIIWAELFYYHFPNGRLVQYTGRFPGSGAYAGIPLANDDIPAGHSKTYRLPILEGCDWILYKDRDKVQFTLLLR